MATLKSDKAQAAVSARYLHAGSVTEVCTYTTTATLSAGDVIQMMKVEPGAVVTGYQLKSTDGELTVALGDGLDPDRYLAATAAGSTLASPIVNLGYEYTASDTVDVLVGGSATGVANVMQAIITVTYDN
ncbi:MAG TPA: hypothetical protein DIT58_01855 [Porticoccaceae bacterium]|nr:hypothetical protein [Porticoccaceae bacterium]